ncbi:hypothetical protein [Wukongibacter sp. M2B1]|uniref:hypothetical protein n=1 Tax=Wukongibacter sp. M2B1 TaxID=3088895 RepID=UPI003D7BC22A
MEYKALIKRQKYIASKKLTIYGFENDEYRFMKYFNNLDEFQIGEIINTLRAIIEDFINLHHENMFNLITGIIAVDKNIKQSLIKA